MREIKFRAWDKNKKKFEYLNIIHSHTIMTGLPIPSMGQWEKLDHFQQYTGIKDKNGKEIYEGDIVLYPDYYLEKVDVGIGMVPVAKIDDNSFYPIEYIDGSFGMNILYNSEIFSKGFISLKEIISNVDYIEVIGNIFETPKLLQ